MQVANRTKLMRRCPGKPFGARRTAELVGLVAMVGAGFLAACEPARIGEPGGGPYPGAGGSSGSSGSGGAAGSAAPGTTVISDRTLCKPGELNVGPAPLRRISRLEYNNMVRDLFGDTSRPADQFAGE